MTAVWIAGGVWLVAMVVLARGVGRAIVIADWDGRLPKRIDPRAVPPRVRIRLAARAAGRWLLARTPRGRTATRWPLLVGVAAVAAGAVAIAVGTRGLVWDGFTPMHVDDVAPAVFR